MPGESRRSQPALHDEVTVGADGRIEIVGTFRPGQRLTVLVVPEAYDFDDLTAAASSSLDFWDNPLDDEDWSRPAAHPRRAL
jgi:hypothetical protein